jgi:hypothetical protein
MDADLPALFGGRDGGGGTDAAACTGYDKRFCHFAFSFFTRFRAP